MKSITLSTLNQVTEALSQPPLCRVVGRGNARVVFPYVRRKNGFGAALWDAIPGPHKYHLGYGNAGGSLKWRGCPGNIVISPEAWDVIKKLQRA